MDRRRECRLTVRQQAADLRLGHAGSAHLLLHLLGGAAAQREAQPADQHHDEPDNDQQLDQREAA
jgi:hypothetical protein